jgi:hypothetical protein
MEETMNYPNLTRYGLTTAIIQEAAATPEYRIARVVRQNRNWYEVMSESGAARAAVSGKLLYLAEGGHHFPAVGDWVLTMILRSSIGSCPGRASLSGKQQEPLTRFK